VMAMVDSGGSEIQGCVDREIEFSPGFLCI
jgi:hypothetical protein